MVAGGGRLRLLLPGYTLHSPAAGGSEPMKPALRRLLARAQWRPARRSTTSSLLEICGFPADTSRAALLAQAELGSAGAGWLRADPVHLRADPKLVMLMAPAPGELTGADADAFLAELRARLPEFVWRRAEDPRRWYVELPGIDATPTLGPAWLHGRSVTPFFPQTPEYRRWRQVMTETQMVMHGSEVNAAREARGALPLNALWIWGGGSIPAAAPTTCRLAVGGDLLLRGAAMAAGVRHAVNVDAPTLAAALAEGDVAVIAGAPFGTWGTSPAAPRESANDHATVLWAALAGGDAAAVDLIGEQLCGTLTRGARWRFWQRRATDRFGDPYGVVAE